MEDRTKNKQRVQVQEFRIKVRHAYELEAFDVRDALEADAMVGDASAHDVEKIEDGDVVDAA